MLKTSQVAERQHLVIGTTAAIVGIAILAGVMHLTWARDPLSSPSPGQTFSSVDPVNPAVVARHPARGRNRSSLD